MKTYKITEIQFFNNTHEVQTGEFEYETVVKYSANIAINDEFVVQVHGNSEEAVFDGACHSTDCFWNDEKKQDEAFETVDSREIESQIEKDVFENNFGWLEDNADVTF